jgi:hypothetical protein
MLRTLAPTVLNTACVCNTTATDDVADTTNTVCASRWGVFYREYGQLVNSQYDLDAAWQHIMRVFSDAGADNVVWQLVINNRNGGYGNLDVPFDKVMPYPDTLAKVSEYHSV